MTLSPDDEELKRLREENRRLRADITPPDITPQDIPRNQYGSTVDTNAPNNKKGGRMSGGGFGLIGIIVVALIISLGINYVMTPIVGVSRKAFDVNLGAVSVDIANIQKTVSGFDKSIEQANSTIAALNQEVASLVASAPNNATKAELDSALATLSTLNSDIASIKDSLEAVKGSVANITTMQTRVTTLENSVASLTMQLTDITASLNTANTKITDLTTRLTAAETYIAELKAGTAITTTTTPTTTTVAGITASFYQSPMTFTGFSATNNPITKKFGIKFTNTAAKDLVYINFTVKMTVSDRVNFDPIEVTSPANINWLSVDIGTGNTLSCTGEAYLYVQAVSGEWTELESLTLTRIGTLTGTYAVTINSITINSKTLQ
jgi:archaellum component FlaC